MAIDARIPITASGLDYPVVDQLEDAQYTELLVKARALGKDVVRVEVEYPGEVWDETGDAVEINFAVTPPTVTTLPPYSEVTP